VTHPLAGYNSAELRAYAAGLRSSTMIAGIEPTGPLSRGYSGIEAGIMLHYTVSTACEREAALIEHFAARLDDRTDQPRPVTPERVAAWAARFERAARFTAPPPEPEPEDAELFPTPREVPLAPWYAQPDNAAIHATLADALADESAAGLAIVPLTSSEWDGTRWVFRDDAGRITMAETREEATAYIAELLNPAPTAEEAAQTGLADAVAESLASSDGRPVLTWTEERKALIALLYPTIIRQEALFTLLNAQPGTPIPSVQAVRQQAAAMDVRRQGLPLPEGYETQPIAARSPQGMPGTVQAATPPDAAPRASLRSDSPWTEERLALLARCYPTIMSIGAILDRLAELPGIEVTGENAVRRKAEKLGLHRRGQPIPPEFAGAAASRSRVPQNAAPIVTAAPAMLPEDKAEALEGLRTGRFRGARAIIEEYGCTQEEAMAIMEQHIARQQKARAA
jgi:hypothetical protein